MGTYGCFLDGGFFFSIKTRIYIYNFFFSSRSLALNYNRCFTILLLLLYYIDTYIIMYSGAMIVRVTRRRRRRRRMSFILYWLGRTIITIRVQRRRFIAGSSNAGELHGRPPVSLMTACDDNRLHAYKTITIVARMPVARAHTHTRIRVRIPATGRLGEIVCVYATN